MRLEFLCTIQIFIDLLSDEHSKLLIFLVCGYVLWAWLSETASSASMWKVRTFESHHEVVEGILILLISLSVVLADILVYCLLDNLDCALMVSPWTEECGVSSGEMWSVSSLLTSRKLPFDIRRECGFELEGIGTKSSCFGKFGSCHCHP